MWRRCCCNCQVDESDQHENGHVKATINNIDGAIMGLKDSTTGKVEPQDAAPQIDIPVLSLDELIEKTDDFGSTALIGEGSYGRVYYAILDNGTKMAVKKLDSTENEPTAEFLTQVGLAIAY
ncbi:PTI1-like tyrosine-protein kinase 3 [Zea mays]|uniref:PTI1-like tyrosine-protein kinase 3 n=1 Tax=Zea mays TaxID=4577 RepID=A0A1D6N4I6_MAIZE|nr:PTI1-like tyrosine-protein kinase 3 [Zea mays]